MNFHQNLRALLIKQGISAAELSRATSIPKATISGWLHGATPRYFRQVKLVGDYFSVSIDSLMYGPNPQPLASASESFEPHLKDIRAGVFEVYLRPIKRR